MCGSLWCRQKSNFKVEQRMTVSKGSLASLTPTSTKPINVRTPKTRLEILEFIKSQREAHFRIGKEKLKIFLDRHCSEVGIKTVSRIYNWKYYQKK